MYSEDFIMSPKVDFAFKELMRDEMVRKGFLSAVLNIKDTDIQSTVLLNTNLPRPHEDDKQSILDVRLTMNDTTEINIEIQLAYMSSWADRSTFYLSKMLVEQVGVNKRYSNLKKCVGISILDFNYIKQTKRFHTVYHITEDTEHIKYTDVLEMHIVELPKLPAADDLTDLYDWVKFIRAKNRSEFQMPAKENVYIKRAYDVLEEISADEQKRMEYNTRQKWLYDYNTMMEENLQRGIAMGEERGIAIGEERGRQQGIAIGEERGIAIGEARGKADMIRRLQQLGNTVMQIADMFKIPESEVERLLTLD